MYRVAFGVVFSMPSSCRHPFPPPPLRARGGYYGHTVTHNVIYFRGFLFLRYYPISPPPPQSRGRSLRPLILWRRTAAAVRWSKTGMYPCNTRRSPSRTHTRSRPVSVGIQITTRLYTCHRWMRCAVPTLPRSLAAWATHEALHLRSTFIRC